MMNGAVHFAEIVLADRPTRIEYQCIGPERAGTPLLVFLHEGLGSLAMWRDFPHRLCDSAGCRGLVYSRPGYGRSTRRSSEEAWDVDFMHRQAQEVLPALLTVLGHDADKLPVWLFGHSDGGSIALLYATRFPLQVAGLVVLAPHIMVEDISVASIKQARLAYQNTDLRARLARYHDDPDSAFLGWNDIWLKPAFRAWSIEAELSNIRCPVLAVQGYDDEYGTMEQIRGIARRLPKTELLELHACGHSPHRDQPESLMTAVTDFINRHTKGDTP